MTVWRVLRKLRGRSSAELRERTGQALAKRAERLHWRDAAEPSDAALLHWFGGSIRSTQAWRDAFASREAPRLFGSFRNSEETARALRDVDPSYSDRVVRRADAALSGRFDLLGYRDLSFGWPIDWQRDPVSGVRAPERHWSTIDYLDAHISGDHKVIWELNRQQWLVDLGAAWWLTRDVRYGHGLIAVLTQWMDANPPKRGVNWASSLEVAFRSISWIWALAFLRRSPLLDATTFARLTKYLVLHARHLERYLSTYFSPNTHLTGEALGLFYIGTYFPELEPAARWRALGESILMNQLPRHVLRDGVYFEQSLHYHRYTVDFYTHLWLLDAANGGNLAVTIAPQLDALLEHVQSLTRGDGTVPRFGDEDGGRLFFLDDRPLDDLRGALATGAVLLERADFAFVAGEPTAELVWLAGPDAVTRFRALTPTPPRYASRAFEEAGVYVLRDGWRADSNHMTVDCGPHGTMNCGHAHADALSFELALRGHPVFVDPGTYTYTASSAERNAFRGTAAHNAAIVDGVDSSEPSGPFHWQRIASSRVLRFNVERDGQRAYFEGSHDGFEHLAHPVRYARSVTFDPSGDGLIVIRDTFHCDGRHNATLTFQCARAIDASIVTPQRIALSRAGVPIGHLETASNVDPDAGRFEIDEAWISPCYGARERAPRCRFHQPLNAGTTVLTSTIRLATAETTPTIAVARAALSEMR